MGISEVPCSRRCKASGGCRPNPEDIAGLRPDIGKNREEARKIMEKAGYGADKRLAVKVSVRNTPPFRDPPSF